MKSKPTRSTASSAPILDAEAIQRALRRIAHEIIEANPNLDSVVLAGVPSRGIEIAQRIADSSSTKAVSFHWRVQSGLTDENTESG